MPAYTSPLDIGNRALDHCGGRAITSLTDGSRNAAKVFETYDKLREEELRANLWVFATRQAVLRPIDVTTMELVPDAFEATVQILRRRHRVLSRGFLDVPSNEYGAADRHQWCREPELG